ncbi:MAG: S9 family peptidase [Saprospiraceae bacterium]|nr:S9 family peptidase [Saprospiraceae bacterium]
MSVFKYPQSRMDHVMDNYHGTQLSDPYRWLEDDRSAETESWVRAQNEVTFAHLDQIPFRKALQERLENLWNYEKYSSPFKEGNTYYYFKNDGLQNQSVLYKTSDTAIEGSVVLDPNTLSNDGTVSLGGLGFSKDGRYMAYLINRAGSDWSSAFVMDMTTGDLLEDRLEWLKFSGIAWHGDGFFYSRYPSPAEETAFSQSNEFHALYYHQLGKRQEDDQLIYTDEQFAQQNVHAVVTEDEKYLFIGTSQSSSGNTLSLVDLDRGYDVIVAVVNNFEHDYSLIGHIGEGILLFLCNEDAPRYKVMAIDVHKPERQYWKEWIPQLEDTLTGVSITGGKLFVTYMHNACSKLSVFTIEGKYIQDIVMPGIGTLAGISGKQEEDQAFFTFTSFTQPNTIYALNAKELTYDLFRASKLDFDTSGYETRQEWFASKDGTLVPMFITMKRDALKDGNHVTLLYGYGGFDISVTPSFSISRLPLLENGGIYAVANIRGGGEFGKAWHKAGILDKKQNVFDDFIAAAEYLIEQRYTQASKLAIQGGSNGGLLVGACMTQRPELFAVALPAVGVFDMLRYHLFTIGWAWAADYGKSDDPYLFRHLLSYSPLHNIRHTAYPATLITTADHDDRVVPAHSFKFAAALQAAQQGDKPVLIRIEVSAGHGAGKPTDKQIKEATDVLGFLFYHTDTQIQY